MHKYNVKEFGVPYAVSDNGSCLFNSVSLALCGSQDIAKELRVRTCIEMVIKKNRFTTLPISSDLLWVSPNYISSVIECAQECGWSSIWTIFALAEVIGIPIKSLYLPLNGVKDFSYKILNLTAIPRNCKDEENRITVMWTRTSYTNPKHIWTPNHFVPLMTKPSFATTRTSIKPVIDCFDEFPPLSPPLSTEPSVLHTKSPKQVIECFEIPSLSSSPDQTPLSTSDIDDLDQFPVLLPSSTTTDSFKNNRLINGNLTATEIFKTIINTESTCYDAIPNGSKENVYFLLDNRSNLTRKTHLKSNQFHDDCGAWDSHNGRTVKTDFVVQSDNTLRFICMKDGQYCIEKQVKGKKTFIPLNPQPIQDTIVTLSRYYTPLKRDKMYKKRVSHFSRMPTQHQARAEISLVEYTGAFPENTAPHGNAKHVTHDYQRTDPKVFDQIQNGINSKKSNIDIYQEMVFKNPENAPRDLQQIRSKRYHDKKQSHQSSSNLPDQVWEALAMVNNHEFVAEAVYTRGNNMPPSIIAYSPMQIEDMKLHIENDKDTILGIDRTFNLGPTYVTNLVYKNKKVVKKSSRDYPIFVGPVFFHWDASYYTYHSFLSHVKARLDTDVQFIDLRIGSDDEGGITKAIDKVFNSAERLLCTKHMKDNITDHLKNKLPLTKTDRSNIMSDLFSEDGIVTAHDEVDFNCKSENLCTKYPVFADYYNKRLKNRILDHVNRPLKRQSNPDRLWTNNNCESMNHRFKIATDWKPQILPELLTKIYDITKLHFIDLKRSLYGQGNYELSPLFQKHYTSPHIWGSKTAEEKDKLFKKLLSSKTFTNKMLTSTNGKLTIPNVKRLARKPGQRHRPKSAAAKTMPRFIK